MNDFTRRQAIRLGAAAMLAPFIKLRAQEPAQKTLGIAFLGLGDYAEKQLAPALAKASNARLAGIITGTPNKIARWQKQYEIPDGNVYTYENFDRIADNKDIDIVYVVTPTGTHTDFSVRAAKAGKHVICEKPMAPTAAECTRMIEAAQQAGVTLQIGYRLHWDPYHLRVMQVMKTAEFGKLLSIEAAHSANVQEFSEPIMKWRIDKELGVAGALYDLGVYAVQAELYTSEVLPLRVTAKHSTERKDIFKEVPETYEWSLEFPGGVRTNSSSSYGREGNFLRAQTEEGKIELDPAYGYSGQKGSTPEGPMEFEQVNQQRLQIEGQVAAILENKPSRVPGEMGRRDIRVLEKIMEAAERGEPVAFDDWGV